MLKTNSKKAKENLKNYIIEHFDGTNYGIEAPQDFKELAKIILDTFEVEKFRSYENARLRHMTKQDLFEEWASGLPSILDTCYYYNRSAIDDLGEILEQTEQERNRYTESQAEKTLTRLIFRTLENA